MKGVRGIVYLGSDMERVNGSNFGVIEELYSIVRTEVIQRR